ESVLGWHRDRLDVVAFDSAVADQPLQALGFGDLGVWGPGFGGETDKTNAGCSDAAGDAYPLLTPTARWTRGRTSSADRAWSGTRSRTGTPRSSMRPSGSSCWAATRSRAASTSRATTPTRRGCTRA